VEKVLKIKLFKNTGKQKEKRLTNDLRVLGTLTNFLIEKLFGSKRKK